MAFPVLLLFLNAGKKLFCLLFFVLNTGNFVQHLQLIEDHDGLLSTVKDLP